jgi:ribosomal protein L1
MKISELKSAIREMIISELNEAEKIVKQGEALPSDSKPGDTIAVVAEDEALMEMAKIAGDLKVAIEKVIEKNKDGEKKDIRKAIKTDDDVQAA